MEKASLNSGTLVLQPIKASLTHDVAFFGKQDPFILFTYGK